MKVDANAYAKAFDGLDSQDDSIHGLFVRYRAGIVWHGACAIDGYPMVLGFTPKGGDL